MYEKTILDTGLRIVTSTMPHTLSASICVFIGTGSRYEAEDRSGISHFVEHMCFKGTERRPSSKIISETIDGIGGVLNGGTDKEITVYWVKVARNHFNVGLDLIVDMLRNSRFLPAEIDSERGIIIEELNMCIDSPQSRVDMLIDETLWPNQALGRDVLGTRETVTAIDRGMILDYFNSNYAASNIVVSVAGNIGHAEIVQAVSDAFGDWRIGGGCSLLSVDDSQNSIHIAIEDRKTEQVNLCLAMRGFSHLHQDRFILELLNVVLGEGMSSRLFLGIREQRGLAYDIHSHISYYCDTGAVSIYAGVDPGNLEATIEAILAELAGLRDEVVPHSELTKAKELSKGRLLLRMEDTRNVSSWIGGQELLTERLRTVDDIVSIIDKITADDLLRVARELFVTDKLNLALVGPVNNRGRLEGLLKL